MKTIARKIPCLAFPIFQILEIGLEYGKLILNPQALVAQKVADDVVFRRFQDEGVEFFFIGPH